MNQHIFSCLPAKPGLFFQVSSGATPMTFLLLLRGDLLMEVREDVDSFPILRTEFLRKL